MMNHSERKADAKIAEGDDSVKFPENAVMVQFEIKRPLGPVNAKKEFVPEGHPKVARRFIAG